MLERLLYNGTSMTVMGALDGLSARHSALANNLANVNTPGYKRKEVPFEEQLKSHVESQLSPCNGAIEGPHRSFVPCAVTDNISTSRRDGNNVDVEQESVALAETAERYQALVQSIAGQLSGLKSVIRGS